MQQMQHLGQFCLELLARIDIGRVPLDLGPEQVGILHLRLGIVAAERDMLIQRLFDQGFQQRTVFCVRP